MPASHREKAGGVIAAGWPAMVLPLLSLLLVLPLLRHGPSCGHDFDFHLQSWMDAAQQLRNGTVWPRWAFSPAYNAGEPRFIFYPPLSWLLGALLLLVVPASSVPAVFTWIALTLSGLGMLALARRFTSNAGALLAAAAYVGNPYMLFTAFERTAYAELLAAAWLPWLLRAVLAERPRLVAIGWPLALLWLTNAPAAVMGTYTLITLVLLRVAMQAWTARAWRPQQHSVSRPVRHQAALLRTGAGGLGLGLSLAAFYVVPAALERRYVQIASAIIPGMRVEDNFLFSHAGEPAHVAVVHTASLIAVALLLLTLAALSICILRGRNSASQDQAQAARGTAMVLALLTLLLAAMLMRFSLPLWHVLPEMVFLQFPWRLVSVLGCLFTTALAAALGRTRIPAAIAVVLALVVSATAGSLASQWFRQGCERSELPANHVALFTSHHGVEATDEYTPLDADNDQLRWDDPPWWLAADPNAPGPNTVPNPAATTVNYDVPPPLSQTVSGRAPMHLQLQLTSPEDLILNLRAYPAWVVRVNGGQPQWLQRDDGLIAVALPAGSDEVDVHWRTLPDVYAGDVLSLGALCILGWAGWRSRSRRIRA